jgi:uncharacterized protein (DUF58 family)
MIKRILFGNFRLIHRASRAVRHRFTPAGLLLAGATVSAGIFGVNTHQTLSYQVFSLGAAALVLAMLTGFRFRPRVRLRRILPRYCTSGQPAVYQCIVESTSRRAQAGWLLIDELREEFPGFKEFQATRDPRDKQRNWFDRMVGYPRLMGWIRRRRGGSIEPVPIEELAPMERLRVNIRLTPVRRGYLHFSRLRLARPDPLGLFHGLRSYPQSESLLVLPRTYRVPAFALGRQRRYQHGGIAQANAVGDSQEFMSLRDYRPGDPMRVIHWRSFAKTGRPVVKEFHDEYFVRQGLVLDTFLENRGRAAFEEAVSVAASFAITVSNQDALLDLLFIGIEAYRFTAGRTLGWTDGMLEVLACVEPCSNRLFSDLSRFVLRHAPETSGLVCVFLDWDDARRGLVADLTARGIPVTVLVVNENVEAPLDTTPLGAHPERLVSVPPGNVQSALDSAFAGEQKAA